MKEKPSIFMSYTHKDKPLVTPLASYLGRLGLKVWIDTADLFGGQSIIEAVSAAIGKADIYVVCLSPQALRSQWVQHELNTAVTLETIHGRPKILPVMVVETSLPPVLMGRLYIDLTQSLDQAKPKIKQSVEKLLGEDVVSQVEHEAKEQHVLISSVRLQLQDETAKYYGGLTHDHDKDDVEEEATELLAALRKRANGILLNFISASEMDFSSRFFKFPNGNLTERIKDIEGPITGTISKRAIVEVEVLNPEDKKLAELISSKLERLGVGRVGYSFVVSPPVQDLPQRSLKRLQDSYVILGWDPDQGAEVELPDELRLSVQCTEEEVNVALETKYRFQLEKRAKEFSVRDFVEWVLKT